MPRHGKNGGFSERLDDDIAKKDWNSDDEAYDEFGRKKRSRAGAGGDEAESARGSAARGRAQGMSAKQQAALARLRSKTGPSARDVGKRSRSRSLSRSGNSAQALGAGRLPPPLGLAHPTA